MSDYTGLSTYHSSRGELNRYGGEDGWLGEAIEAMRDNYKELELKFKDLQDSCKLKDEVINLLRSEIEKLEGSSHQRKLEKERKRFTVAREDKVSRAV